ncbi:hypothetical protein [Hymenobacter terricola]|uniref:hypothetical protein n=1 Tax=Hymenobacter terricola TaxID=2819236 RepID=UPI001B3090CB|nr:hypothetical protein [Hymenobacter terricola]
MTHFRFRYKQIGYMRWRCRAARRRATLLVLPMAAAARYASAMAPWRRTAPVFVSIMPVAAVLRVGDFVVSEEGDSQLSGHPGIRY